MRAFFIVIFAFSNAQLQLEHIREESRQLRTDKIIVVTSTL